MNPEELKQMLKEAREALAAGRDSTEVDAIITKATGGQFNNMVELAGQDQSSVQPGKSGAIDRQQWPSLVKEAQIEFDKEGADLGKINSRIGELTGGRFNNLGELKEGVAAIEKENEIAELAYAGQSTEGIQPMLRLLAEGAFPLIDEVVGAGASLVPGGKTGRQARVASRAKLDKIREERGGLATATELTGAALVPGAGTVGLLRMAGKAATGIRGAGQALIAGNKPISPIRQWLRAGARGSAIGATEAGLYTGAASEGSLFERAQQSVIPSLFAGAAGGVVGSVVGGKAASRQLQTAEREAGETLSGRLNQRTRGDTPLQVAAAGKARKEAISKNLFGPIERAALPPEVTDVVLKNPRLKAVMKRINPKVVSQADEVAAGTRMTFDQPTYTEVQETAIIMREKLRLARGSATKSARPDEMRKISKQFDELDDIMTKEIAGHEEATKAWNEVSSDMRAYSAGRDSGKLKVSRILDKLDEVPEGSREYFREGLIQDFSEDLRLQKGITSQVSEMLNAGSATNQKLRIMIPDDAQYALFQRDIRDLGRAITANKVTKAILQYGGFMYLGSSIAGKIGYEVGLFGPHE